MSTKHCIILLSAAIFLMTTACNKPKYKACFTTSKDTFAIGETIWFNNCSDFDGASEINVNSWYFTDTQTYLIVSSGHDSMSWVYNAPGVKNPKLKTGTKENGDEASKQIVVIP